MCRQRFQQLQVATTLTIICNRKLKGFTYRAICKFFTLWLQILSKCLSAIPFFLLLQITSGENQSNIFIKNQKFIQENIFDIFLLRNSTYWRAHQLVSRL
jgi:hypothetical protein